MIIGRNMCLKTLFFTRKFSKSTKEVWERYLRNSHRTSLKRFIQNHHDVTNVILKNTEMTCNHLTPELKLFLLTENCPLYHEPFNDKYTNGIFDSLTRNVLQDPFWSIYWPGGQVLARFILEEKERILGSMTQNVKKDTIRILDLGAGCGAVAIAVKLMNETCKIVANDISKVACVAIAMNAILNNTDIEVLCKNLLEKPLEDSYDMIFVGDLLYDEEIANTLVTWLGDAHERGTQIYLGDPGRHGLNENFRKRLKLIRQYSLPENVKKENNGYDMATVWKFN
ncbi:UPF0516 protein C12orf72 like protein [Trachymyrmex zeteki]|uniref:ETFB lysine methyltransferase n=2 Tax=Mycetomoellerius zeteki TaxID=64791 RepID=A0A151XEC3_9HYME|nr:UPF0516 protein C12orf72 like protein [Trachymyrmex zeteki]